MKLLLFGYGSLINLESASRTLKRSLTGDEVYTGVLHGYERNWSLWDDVIAETLGKQVRGVFLNLVPAEKSFLNGVMIEITEEELKYFLLREKNYTCTDISQSVTFHDELKTDEFKIITFVGKKEHVILEDTTGYFVFDKYIKIVNDGVEEFGGEFVSLFNETTTPFTFKTLPGAYTFVDNAQQTSR